MNTITTPTRRVYKELVIGGVPSRVEQVEKVHQCAQVPPQGYQVHIVGGGNEVPMVASVIDNGDIIEAFLNRSQSMTTRVNRDIGPRMNAMDNTMTYRLRDFVRLNPHIFLGSKVGKDPQAFLDEMYKNVYAMGVIYIEKVELDPYQWKDVAQVWFTQWKYSRSI